MFFITSKKPLTTFSKSLKKLQVFLDQFKGTLVLGASSIVQLLRFSPFGNGDGDGGVSFCGL